MVGEKTGMHGNGDAQCPSSCMDSIAPTPIKQSSEVAVGRLLKGLLVASTNAFSRLVSVLFVCLSLRFMSVSFFMYQLLVHFLEVTGLCFKV